MKRYVVLALLLSLAGCQTTPYVGAGREFRTVNTSTYELSITKSGRMSVRLPTGAIVLTNAYPALFTEQDQQPKPINIHGAFSTRTMGKTKLGEGHGIVLEKKKYLSLCRSPQEIRVMQQLKRAFDPHNILNPGRIFDLDLEESP